MRISLVLSVIFGLLTVLPTLGQERKPEQDRRQQQVLFRFVFSVQGVEFSKDQQVQIEKLRQKYTPQLTEFQRKQNSIFTAEQRRARQETLRAARDGGKNGEEARVAAEKAAKLSDEQLKELTATRKQQSELLAIQN